MMTLVVIPSFTPRCLMLAIVFVVSKTIASPSYQTSKCQLWSLIQKKATHLTYNNNSRENVMRLIEKIEKSFCVIKFCSNMM
jgi:hypothetical protein